MFETCGFGTLRTPPQTGVIVKWRNCTGGPSKEWCDDNDSSWENLLETSPNNPIQMPDRDVAIIDADATTPSICPTCYTPNVGTLNFGIAVNPDTGRLYVSNTDARNHVRFEGGLEILGDGMGNEDGVCDDGEPCTVALDGHLVDTRVTVATGTSVDGFIDLNPHIDFSAAISSIDKSLSLGQPNGMAFNIGGDRLYAAALLSKKVAVIDTGSVPGTLLARIDVGEGPTGVAFLEPKSRLYVLNRFENTVSVVDTGTNSEILPRLSLFNPEPNVITGGRKFLYDAQLTSGRGDVACATCHTFGNFDLLAWDLGDPTRTEPFDARPSQTPTGVGVECADNPNQCGCGPFHPLKGPRTTQSLRGLSTTEPFHWHGDRPDFQAFNKAFPGLLRNDAELSSAEMDAFTDFIMTVVYPPNPNRGLDDTLSAAAASGLSEYMSVNRDAGGFTCNQCHALPTGTNGRFINAVADQVQQAMKTPQLRNMYEKTGMSLHPDPGEPVPSETQNGFGFIHDGSVETLVTFLSNPIFTFVPQGDITELNNMVAFLLEFPTGQTATVGHAITFDGGNNGDAQLLAEFGILLSVLDQGSIDLVVKGFFGGIPRSFRCTSVNATTATCQPDREGEAAIDAAVLRDMAASGSELTFLATPVGFGQRMGLDRDGDGFFDRDEIDAGSDPANAASTPASAPIPALGWRGGWVFAAILFLLLRVRRWRRSPA
jgi:hypothetical protein